MIGTARKQMNVNFGMQRNLIANYSPDINLVSSPEKLDSKLQSVLRMICFGDYIWIVVHYFILRFSLPVRFLRCYYLFYNNLCNLGYKTNGTINRSSRKNIINMWI